MTLEDKLRFLADRAEDGKPFLIDDVEYVLDDNVLKTGDVITIKINSMQSSDLKLKPTWEFTADEKVILRNLKDKWRWIARNADGLLLLHCGKPRKESERTTT